MVQGGHILPLQVLMIVAFIKFSVKKTAWIRTQSLLVRLIRVLTE